MNTNEYIKSGILEDYVLGTASEQERKEVECMSKIYPEIKTELSALEQSIGQYISFYQKTPPAHLKEKIFAQMTFDETPAVETELPGVETEPEISTIKVVPMWSKLAIAASLLLAALSVSLYVSKNKVSEEMAAVKTELEGINAQKAQTDQLLALYGNSQNELVTLKGTEKSPESEVKVFWNKQNNEVALLVDKLPKTDAAHQYQLWTIVDGKPVDMGMIDADFDGKIHTMKTISGNVAAFAITLEKAGGSPSPTLEEMYVMAAV